MPSETICLTDYLREKMLRLSDACPFDGTNPCKCPFHDIRTRGHAVREKWVRELSQESILDLLIRHQYCLNEKNAETDTAHP